MSALESLLGAYVVDGKGNQISVKTISESKQVVGKFLKIANASRRQFIGAVISECTHSR